MNIQSQLALPHVVLVGRIVHALWVYVKRGQGLPGAFILPHHPYLVVEIARIDHHAELLFDRILIVTRLWFVLRFAALVLPLLMSSGVRGFALAQTAVERPGDRDAARTLKLELVVAADAHRPIRRIVPVPLLQNVGNSRPIWRAALRPAAFLLIRESHRAFVDVEICGLPSTPLEQFRDCVT